MRFRWLLLLVVVATGCATTSGYQLRFGHEGWKAGVKERGFDPADLVYPFETSPALEQWAQEVAGGYSGMGDIPRLHMLQDAMFDRDAFTFDYDATMTLKAADAFEVRRGNCLAFTSLFVAASRSIGVSTFLVSVRHPPEVEKKQDLVVINRHVVAGYSDQGRLYMFDFYATSKVPYFQHIVVDDVKATAMFHNNIGGAAIRDGELELAQHHLELATHLAPDLAPSWVNLGVAMHREGNNEDALEAYRRALEVQPGHPSALTNIAFVYQQMGMDDEARAALRAAAESRSTPFALIALADVEMARGNLAEAQRYLKRARRLARNEPEVYEALARLAERSGNQGRVAKLRQRASQLRTERPAETMVGDIGAPGDPAAADPRPVQNAKTERPLS